MSLVSKVKVRVHEASFVDKNTTGQKYYFINVRNNYKRRCITIVHIFAINPSLVFINNSKRVYIEVDEIVNINRPLPTLVNAGKEWETWIIVPKDLHMGNPLNQFMVELNNNRYITSSKRKGVSPSGTVPGEN